MSRRTDGTQREHLRRPRDCGRPGGPVSPELIARRAAAETEAQTIRDLMKAQQQARQATSAVTTQGAV